jgi:hypothetical protein
MDPKEQAIAALELEQVAQSAGHREHAGKIAFNATTGSDMKSPTTHNSVVSKHADAHGSMQMVPETERNWTGKVEGREYLTNAAAANQPSSNSNHNSQSTTDGYGIATPPTSEGFSSQSTNQDGSLSQLSQLSQLAAAQQPLASTTTRPKLAISPTAGQKRTADGQVKITQSSPTNDPKPRGHSRNVSAISNVSNTSSRIGEVRYLDHHPWQ